MSERYTAEILSASTFTELADMEAALITEVTARGGSVEFMFGASLAADQYVRAYRTTTESEAGK